MLPTTSLGLMLPQLTLESSAGPVSLRELGLELLVLYVYPRTGRPDQPVAFRVGRDSGSARLHA